MKRKRKQHDPSEHTLYTPHNRKKLRDERYEWCVEWPRMLAKTLSNTIRQRETNRFVRMLKANCLRDRTIQYRTIANVRPNRISNKQMVYFVQTIAFSVSSSLSSSPPPSSLLLTSSSISSSSLSSQSSIWLKGDSSAKFHSFSFRVILQSESRHRHHHWSIIWHESSMLNVRRFWWWEQIVKHMRNTWIPNRLRRGTHWLIDGPFKVA